jgi:lysophospholipase L1-like esterase
MRGALRGVVVPLAFLIALTSCSSSGGGSDAAPRSSSAAASDSASGAPSPTVTGTYLALGDSIPFGFRAGLSDEYRDADNFTGYPELIGKDLGVNVVNATCPGESTKSFLDVTAQSHGCENAPGRTSGYRTTFPLHVDYASAQQSQLDFAVQTLKNTPDVGLVSVQIGANDAFVCQAVTADRCSAPAEYQALGQTIQTNLGTILTTLRGAGGYDGPIVVVTYYSWDYRDPTVTGFITLLNGALSAVAQANGAVVADAFTAFRHGAQSAGGDTMSAGLVAPNDVHPTEAGQQLLAETVESALR